MFSFQISDINKMGEPDPKFGQTFWGHVSDDLTPVMFNSHAEVLPGTAIVADIKEMKKSAKGTTYWRLKGVKVAEAMQIPDFGEEPPESPPEKPQSHIKAVSNEEIMAQLISLHEKMDRLMEPTYE